MCPLSFHKEYATPGQLTNTYLFRVLKKLFCLKSQEWDPSLSLYPIHLSVPPDPVRSSLSLLAHHLKSRSQVCRGHTTQ